MPSLSFFSGISVTLAVFSFVYIKIDSFLGWNSAPAIKNNSIFNSIIDSFFPNDVAPIFALRNDFGLTITKPVPANHSILTLSLDTNPFVIDGTRNVPSQLSILNGFSDLSQEARTVISIAVYKVSSDEFSNPLSLLWKGVGVWPIPDVRWVGYLGLFALGVNQTGVAEIDRHIVKSLEVLGECGSFLKNQQSLNRSLHLIDEAELRWTWVFLNAYGISINKGVKILEPHLMFARRTLDITKAVTVKLEGRKIKVTSQRNMQKGDELFLDATGEMSDGFALLFHGSWIADESIHRGRFWFPVSQTGCATDEEFPQGVMSVWLSNDTQELEVSRAKILRCFSDPREMLKKALLEMHTGIELPHKSAIEAVRFQYFNLLYSEYVYWEERIARGK